MGTNNKVEVPLETRLKSKQILDEKTGCLLFRGSLNRGGYGQINGGPRGSRPYLAHRVAAFIAGIIPSLDDPAMVCHTCDVRSCTEPTHLYKGDAASNMK